MKKFKIPSKISKSQIENFFKKINLHELIAKSKGPSKDVNQMKLSSPYVPELIDLYYLYNFIILNKRITILEFGSGWSTIIMIKALSELKKKFSTQVKKLRRNNPFEIFIVDNEKKFLNISKKRIRKVFGKKLDIKVHFLFSSVKMCEYKGRFASHYEKLPSCNPDFVYLDGPDQFNIKGKVQNITIKHKDMMPMNCDLIKFEYFFTPGTIILTDGRAANVKFLKDHFNRNWIYKNNKISDQHFFYLDDSSLGKYNDRQLKFYK